MFKALGGTIVLVVSSLPAGAVPRAQESPGSWHPVPIRFIAGRLPIVPVTVEGTGPYPFLLDTGATSTMIDERLADALGMTSLGAAVHETLTASRPLALLRATVALGPVEHRGEVGRASLDALRALDPTIRGVVGQDLLRGANWWLDNRRSVLFAAAEGALSPDVLGERVAIQWAADRPAIDGRLPDRTSLRLVLDSAAASAVLFREASGDGGPLLGWARATTHDGEAMVPLVAVGPLRVGQVVIRAFTAGLMADAAAGRPGEDGVLPTGLFDAIYFDNRSGVVVLNPRLSSGPSIR